MVSLCSCIGSMPADSMAETCCHRSATSRHSLSRVSASSTLPLYNSTVRSMWVSYRAFVSAISRSWSAFVRDTSRSCCFTNSSTWRFVHSRDVTRPVMMRPTRLPIERPLSAHVGSPAISGGTAARSNIKVVSMSPRFSYDSARTDPGYDPTPLRSTFLTAVSTSSVVRLVSGSPARIRGASAAAIASAVWPDCCTTRAVRSDTAFMIC